MESLRATTFHRVGMSLEELTKWWREVAGDDPENVVMRPREGVVQVSGPFEGKQLVLGGRTDRVDWILQPVLGHPSTPTYDLPTLGELSPAIKPLNAIVDLWLRKSPDVTRMAFGAILVWPVVDLAEATRELSRLIPNVTLDERSSTDFLYQINRPRTSKSREGLEINRLTKWSRMRYGALAIAIGSDSEVKLSGESGQLACRLELDVNTSAGSLEPIPQDEARELFRELMDLGMEIAAQGDIP